MELQAKITQTCDSCGAVIDKKDENTIDNIKAVLEGPDGKNKDYHVCDEDCLLDLLKKRSIRRNAKKAKKSKASLFEFEFQKKYFPSL